MSEFWNSLAQWFGENLPASQFVAVGSIRWWGFVALILAGRACDLGSTYLATPRLKLEGNPIARRLGWRGGLWLGGLTALLFGAWPLIAISITTTSGLVAARNFQHAWIMRTMGEGGYQLWFADTVSRAPSRLVLGCYWAEATLSGLPGVALLIWGEDTRVSLGIGLGLTAYGVAIAVFSTHVLWGLVRRDGPR